jgi:DNA-binding transcriptional ArsR family regulator
MWEFLDEGLSPEREGNSIIGTDFLFPAARICTSPMNPALTNLIEHQEQIETAARALKAISHPLRLKILCVLGPDEVCVQDIVEAVGTSQSNISQHLGILRDKGVLQTRKDANRVFYRVADQRTLQLVIMMREVFCGVPAEAH